MEKVFSKGVKLMGNQFQFSVVGGNQEWAEIKIHEGIAEVRRIEDLFTTYRESSQTNLINGQAGLSPVKVDKEVFDLIERSLRISELTQGAFDITYGSIDKSLWNFDRNMQRLPDRRKAKEMVRLINFRNVVLDKEKGTVFLREKGMRIGFGGIGKGYAAERAKAVMVRSGVLSGVVNAAGDLTVWGKQPNGTDWTIGIADPEKHQLPFASLRISDSAVATSGTYEKFAVIGGRKYSHTIDPKTGYPVSGIKSVTIICHNAEIADALATPVMVMGVSAGLNMINQMKGIGCIVIDDSNRLYTSDNVNIDANEK